jgi:hypothetical protein
MTVSTDTFFEEGKKIFKGKRKDTRHRRALHTDMALFHAFFGTWPNICAELWHRIDPYENIHPRTRAVHLLWALLFMTNYTVECVNAALVGCDEDTFRKWTRPWISNIALLSLELIQWDARFEGNWHFWTFCVDGIHCPIYEPRRPFWTGWYSNKFKGAALAYEVATAVTTGKIVSINGPFPAGRWNDPMMFKNNLAKRVITGVEKGVCDAGYFDCHEWLFRAYWRSKGGLKEKLPRNDLHERIRARHEQLNSRLHRFNCVASIFRHDITMHGDFFNACAVIVQLEIINGLASQFDVVPKPWVAAEQYDSTPDPREQYPAAI